MAEAREPQTSTWTAPLLAWSLCALSLLLLGAFLWLEVQHHRALGTSELLFDGSSAAFGLAFPVVGAFLAARRPRNPIGWLMLAIGISFVTSSVAHAYSQWAPLSGHGSPAAAQWAAWVGTWAWAPGWGLTFTLLLLLFPDGRLPTPGWRWAAQLSVAAVALETIGSMLDPNPTGNPLYRNPLGVHSPASVGGIAAGAFEILGTVATVVAAIACLVALVRRYRRSRGDERQQMKWFAYGGVLFVVLLPANTALADGRPVLGVLALVAVPILPVSIAVGVLKYRLYDIDVVIRRTVVFALLAAFITGVYAVVVGGIGALLGRQSAILAFAAAIVVAIAFQPARDRARRVADRFVYGKRATPYEVLTEFSHQAAQTGSSVEVLPTLAKLLAQATGAVSTTVWLRRGPAFVASAVWPSAPLPPPVPSGNGDVPMLPGGEVFSVAHGADVLGAIAMQPSPSEPLNPGTRRLVLHVAGQAGLILRNAALVEDLRASRQRIVAAQDEQRRRIERSLRQGPDRRLLALDAQLAAAQETAAAESAGAATAVTGLRDDARAALENIRALAAGVYPATLTERGTAAALEAQAVHSAVPISVVGEGSARHPTEAEAGVYFCALEAIQNALKYAEASHIRVRVESSERALAFEVADDGRGFDPDVSGFGTGLRGIADRIAAIGGTLDVRSAPGHGTIVAGAVPSPALESVPA
jgi:signal transduction histidine kinase